MLLIFFNPKFSMMKLNELGTFDNYIIFFRKSTAFVVENKLSRVKLFKSVQLHKTWYIKSKPFYYYTISTLWNGLIVINKCKNRVCLKPALNLLVQYVRSNTRPCARSIFEHFANDISGIYNIVLVCVWTVPVFEMCENGKKISYKSNYQETNHIYISSRYISSGWDS